MSEAATEAARRQAVRFAKAYWQEHGSAPPVRVIIKNCDLLKSSRHFYELFPGRVAELCKIAGIPLPENRLRVTEKAGLMRRQGGAEESGPKLEAKIFQLLEKGTPLPTIVGLLGHPDHVLELSKKWRRLKEADVNQPLVLRELKTLRSDASELGNRMTQLRDSSAAFEEKVAWLHGMFCTLFAFRKCPKCQAEIPVPMFAMSYVCIHCAEVLGQTSTRYAVSHKDGRVYYGEFPNPPK